MVRPDVGEMELAVIESGANIPVPPGPTAPRDPHQGASTGWRRWTEQVAERAYALRDRMLADPRMQRLSVTIPFVRPFAEKRARALFDICIGFVYTQVVTACVELDLFERLAEGPRDLSALAAECDLPAEEMQRLLEAAVALKLVARSGGTERYRLGELGAALRGAPGVTAMVRHHRMVYRDLHDPVGLLRHGPRALDTELSRYWGYADNADAAELGPERTAPYTGLMAASQPMISEDVIRAYDFTKHRRLLDVGGSDGRFAEAVARSAQNITATVLDVPAVADAATVRFAELSDPGLKARLSAASADFRVGPLPTGFDVVSLIRILLDHDDETVANLLQAVHAALPLGGRVVIAEAMSGTKGAEPISDAYFGFYLKAMGRGRPRSVARISALLSDAGFANPRLVRTHRPLLAQVLTAEKLA